MSDAGAQPRSLARLVVGQGTYLFSGFAVAQAMSLARNAILGHWLSKGDFGVAATLTLLLQLLETLTDLGADRLIVQAKDGDDQRFMASQHTALILRGVLTALAIHALSGSAAKFFSVPEAAWAFAAIAAVPLIKGFQHLDARRAQRHMNNAPYLAVEIIPQAMALAFLVPVLNGLGGYASVVWMGLLQALALLLTSHAVADRRYEIAFDVAILKRLFAFGWPIWLSAFPLIAVYQGDRMVIGKLLGMEAIAAYAACFMIAMVPGLIAAKVGNALMLPLFSRVIENPKAFASRFRAMTDATTLGAALYLANVTIAGGDIVRVTFGPNYSGYGPLAATLALMWSIRLLQAVPGMALLAHGETRPFLVAGLLRASAILPVMALAAAGYGLVAIAAAGVAGEIASLIYVTWRVARLGEGSGRGLGVTFLSRSAMLAPALAISTAVVRSMPANGGLTTVAVAVMALSCIIVVAACLLSPHLRGLLAHARDEGQAVLPATVAAV